LLAVLVEGAVSGSRESGPSRPGTIDRTGGLGDVRRRRDPSVKATNRCRATQGLKRGLSNRVVSDAGAHAKAEPPRLGLLAALRLTASDLTAVALPTKPVCLVQRLPKG